MIISFQISLKSNTFKLYKSYLLIKTLPRCTLGLNFFYQIYVIPWHIKERVGDSVRFIGYEHVTACVINLKVVFNGVISST